MKPSRKTQRKINRLFVELCQIRKDAEIGIDWAISRREEIIKELDKIYQAN